MKRYCLASLALIAATAAGQDKTAKKAEALPEGQTKVFQAVVIQVEGVAQARPDPDAKWKKLAINDVLEPGAVVRTGRKSEVTLRVGKNATILIERQSRIAIPEIVQNGDVLKTRVSMNFGKADVKVNRIGLVNDFEVSTPTATLAVRGTVFRISWDPVNGFRSVGVPGNKIRAIEIAYLDGVKAYLSKADGSDSRYKLPAVQAFNETYLGPLKGSASGDEYPDADQSQDSVNSVLRQSSLTSGNKGRGESTGRTGQGQITDNTDTKTTDGSGISDNPDAPPTRNPNPNDPKSGG